jgi:lysophospholipase L1-like esterase
MALKIKSGQTIVFIGDSITDCDRRGAQAPLGNGYVKLFSGLLAAREPEKQITIINKGIGGDTCVGMQARWDDDVMRFKPDWLSVKIGINDLHSNLGEGLFWDKRKFTPEIFEAAYDDILGRTREAFPRCQMLLIDPFYLSVDSKEGSPRKAVLDLLPKYQAVVHKMSKKYGTRLVETHKMFQRMLKHYDTEMVCAEPVHPNTTGHLAIADAVYEALSK